jgi:tetratricopeptide (TPR) repeat protein
MLSKVYLSHYDRGAKEAMEEAVRYADIALKIDPYYAEEYETAGMIFERQGKIKEAAALYEKAFHVNPNLAGPIQKIEELSRKLGEVEHAREIFSEAAQRFPDNLEVFKALERLK